MRHSILLPVILLLAACAPKKEAVTSEKVLALYNAGKPADALELLGHIYFPEDDSVDYYNLRGSLHKELDNFDAALADYNRAVELQPENDSSYYNRALLFFEKNQWYKCIRDHDSALQYASGDSMKFRIVSGRALAKERAEDTTGACNDYRQALAINPADIAVLLRIAHLLEGEKKYNEAIGYMKKAITLDTLKDIAIIGNLGFMYSNAGDYKTAITYFNRVLVYSPDDPLAFNNRGYARLKLGDTKGAMEDIEHSIQLKGNNSYAYKNRALVYIAMRQKDKACADLEQAMDLGYNEQYDNEVKMLMGKYCPE